MHSKIAIKIYQVLSATQPVAECSHNWHAPGNRGCRIVPDASYTEMDCVLPLPPSLLGEGLHAALMADELARAMESTASDLGSGRFAVVAQNIDGQDNFLYRLLKSRIDHANAKAQWLEAQSHNMRDPHSENDRYLLKKREEAMVEEHDAYSIFGYWIASRTDDIASQLKKDALHRVARERVRLRRLARSKK